MSPATDHGKRRATTPPDPVEGLRERKKRATRLFISNVATKLFIARGFEQVTIDDVAVAANVSKMTVFNYFPRKEDLFFDRNDAAREVLRTALGDRGRRSPIEALRVLAHDLVEQGHPATKVNRDVVANWKTVADSPALRARAFDLLEELGRDLGHMLAVSVDAPAAVVLLGAWRVAFADALRRQRSASVATLRKDFLDLLDRGFAAASVAARGTRYT
jgi:AcrR family transcriptional regulator